MSIISLDVYPKRKVKQINFNKHQDRTLTKMYEVKLHEALKQTQHNPPTKTTPLLEITSLALEKTLGCTAEVGYTKSHLS